MDFNKVLNDMALNEEVVKMMDKLDLDMANRGLFLMGYIKGMNDGLLQAKDIIEQMKNLKGL